MIQPLSLIIPHTPTQLGRFSKMANNKMQQKKLTCQSSQPNVYQNRHLAPHSSDSDRLLIYDKSPESRAVLMTLTEHEKTEFFTHLRRQLRQMGTTYVNVDGKDRQQDDEDVRDIKDLLVREYIAKSFQFFAAAVLHRVEAFFDRFARGTKDQMSISRVRSQLTESFRTEFTPDMILLSGIATTTLGKSGIKEEFLPSVGKFLGEVDGWVRHRGPQKLSSAIEEELNNPPLAGLYTGSLENDWDRILDVCHLSALRVHDLRCNSVLPPRLVQCMEEM